MQEKGISELDGVTTEPRQNETQKRRTSKKKSSSELWDKLK